MSVTWQAIIGSMHNMYVIYGNRQEKGQRPQKKFILCLFLFLIYTQKFNFPFLLECVLCAPSLPLKMIPVSISIYQFNSQWTKLCEITQKISKKIIKLNLFTKHTFWTQSELILLAKMIGKYFFYKIKELKTAF